MAQSAWFGPRLRELREAAGLTQQQLASKSAVALGALRDLEQGTSTAPRWDTVLALATALGVDCTAFTTPPATDAGPRPRGRPKASGKTEVETDEGKVGERKVAKGKAKGKGKKKGKGSNQ